MFICIWMISEVRPFCSLELLYSIRGTVWYLDFLQCLYNLNIFCTCNNKCLPHWKGATGAKNFFRLFRWACLALFDLFGPNIYPNCDLYLFCLIRSCSSNKTDLMHLANMQLFDFWCQTIASISINTWLLISDIVTQIFLPNSKYQICSFANFSNFSKNKMSMFF